MFFYFIYPNNSGDILFVCPVGRSELMWSEGIVPLVQGVSIFIRVPDCCISNGTPYLMVLVRSTGLTIPVAGITGTGSMIHLNGSKYLSVCHEVHIYI